MIWATFLNTYGVYFSTTSPRLQSRIDLTTYNSNKLLIALGRLQSVLCISFQDNDMLGFSRLFLSRARHKKVDEWCSFTYDWRPDQYPRQPENECQRFSLITKTHPGFLSGRSPKKPKVFVEEFLVPPFYYSSKYSRFGGLILSE